MCAGACGWEWGVTAKTGPDSPVRRVTWGTLVLTRTEEDREVAITVGANGI